MVIWFATIIYIPNGVLVITKLEYIPRNTPAKKLKDPTSCSHRRSFLRPRIQLAVSIEFGMRLVTDGSHKTPLNV
jgi:hypothetical protein